MGSSLGQTRHCWISANVLREDFDIVFHCNHLYTKSLYFPCDHTPKQKKTMWLPKPSKASVIALTLRPFYMYNNTHLFNFWPVTLRDVERMVYIPLLVSAISLLLLISSIFSTIYASIVT